MMYMSENIIDITPNLERRNAQGIYAETGNVEEFKIEGVPSEKYPLLYSYPRPLIGAVYLNGHHDSSDDIVQKIIYSPNRTIPLRHTEVDDFIGGYDQLVMPYKDKLMEIHQPIILEKLRTQMAEITARKTLRTMAAFCLYKPSGNKPAIYGFSMQRTVFADMQNIHFKDEASHRQTTMYQWFEKNYDYKMPGIFPFVVAASFLPSTEELWNNWSRYFVQ